MDVRLHRAGADAVAGIEIAVAGDAVIRPPTRLRPTFLAELGAAAIGLARHARIELHGAKVMLIAALQMHDLAEQPLAHHVEHGEDVAPVADIFEPHVGSAGGELGAPHVTGIVQSTTWTALAAEPAQGLPHI